MRRLVPIALTGIALLAGIALTSRGTAAPVGAATTTATATATKSPTPPPPSSLPARFVGKISFAPGIKGAGKTALAAYSDANTKCVEAAPSSSAYAITVPKGVDRPGCPNLGGTVYFKLGDYWAEQQGLWSPGIPQTLDLTFPKMDAIPLNAGCALTTLSYSDNTAVKIVLQNITPAEAPVALWRWNGTDWEGYFPGGPTSMNNLKVFNRLDIVWICSTSAATLDRPSLGP